MRWLFLTSFVLTVVILSLVNRLVPKNESQAATEVVPSVAPKVQPHTPEQLFCEIPQSKEVDPEFLNWGIQNSDSSLYNDIMSHATRKEYSGNRITDAHETTHFINNDIRNAQGGHKNAFYVFGGKAVVIDEPKMARSAVAPYIPRSISNFGSTWRTYVSNSGSNWQNEPLYFFDEWSAYTNGCLVAYQEGDKQQAGFEDGNAVEFSIYAVAVAMAVKDNDPEYWKNNQQFRNFLIWQLKRTEKIFKEHGSDMTFNEENLSDYINKLRTGEDTKKMREFIKENFDGVFLN